MRGLVLLFAGFILAASARAESVFLDRAKAVELALQRNESHQSVLLEKDRVRGMYIEARAGALPRLTLEGAYRRDFELSSSIITLGDSTMRLTFGAKNNYRAQLRVYQPIYIAGKVGAALKIAGYADRQVKSEITTSEHNTATAADRAFLDAVAARQAVRAYREAEALADSTLAVIELRNRHGQVSEYDLLRAQVQAANSRPDRIAAENNARLAEDRLRNLLALESHTELGIDTLISVVAIGAMDDASLILEALQNRPELAVIDEGVRINQKLIDIARGGYKPSLSMSSSLEWQGLSNEFTPGSDDWNRSWNASLDLTWPIFSGFEVTGQVRQAKVDLHQSELRQAQLRRQVELEVRAAIGDVREAQQRVEALGQTVDQAVRGAEISEVRYLNGVGTQLELLDAQVALTAARVNEITARHDLAVATSELRRAVGRSWAPQW